MLGTNSLIEKLELLVEGSQALCKCALLIQMSKGRAKQKERERERVATTDDQSDGAVVDSDATKEIVAGGKKDNDAAAKPVAGVIQADTANRTTFAASYANGSGVDAAAAAETQDIGRAKGDKVSGKSCIEAAMEKLAKGEEEEDKEVDDDEEDEDAGDLTMLMAFCLMKTGVWRIGAEVAGISRLFAPPHRTPQEDFCLKLMLQALNVMLQMDVAEDGEEEEEEEEEEQEEEVEEDDEELEENEALDSQTSYELPWHNRLNFIHQPA